jgi:hypothetical protein
MQAGARWNYRRKAALLDAIAAGQIDEAVGCEKYGLSREELAEWRRKYVPGRAASLKIYQASPRSFPGPGPSGGSPAGSGGENADKPKPGGPSTSPRTSRRAVRRAGGFSQADAEELVPGTRKTPKGYG